MESVGELEVRWNTIAILYFYFYRSIQDESDSDDNTSSNDTNISIPVESNTDMNESHDNNELKGDIAAGGLASFVKSSSMNDDYCKFLILFF